MKIITYLSDKNKGERGLVRLGGGGGFNVSGRCYVSAYNLEGLLNRMFFIYLQGWLKVIRDLIRIS